jgi:hypothetical protein
LARLLQGIGSEQNAKIHAGGGGHASAVERALCIADGVRDLPFWAGKEV